MSPLLIIYRVLAYVTGTGLVLLVCVAMPLKYLGDNPELVELIGPMHGFLYALYAFVTLALGYVRRWSWRKTLLVLLAGTVPFVTFYAEWKVRQSSVAETSAARG